MDYINTQVEILTQNAIEAINNNTALTFLTKGSKVRALVDILAEELSLASRAFDEGMGQAFIRNAKGQLLDFIGEVYGMERLKSKKALVLAEEENFYFYTNYNNFGEINGGQDIFIPKNSLTLTTADPNSDLIYTNSEDITLPANQQKVFFAARSAFAGSEANIGENTLTFHDFTNYVDAENRSLLVSNGQAVTYGRDAESDDNFRYRIQQYKISTEAGNETAIKLALLQIPGVADVIKIKYRRGIGTCDWLIRSTSPTAPASLIYDCQEAIERIQSEGMDNQATAPVTIGVEMFFSLTYSRVLEDSEKEKIKSEVRANIADLVNNLAIGADFIRDQVVKVILNSSNEIQSVGETDSSANFSNIFIYKRSALSNSKIKKTLIGDYKAAPDERIVLEPTVQNPIVIHDNN